MAIRYDANVVEMSNRYLRWINDRREALEYSAAHSYFVYSDPSVRAPNYLHALGERGVASITIMADPEIDGELNAQRRVQLKNRARRYSECSLRLS